MVRPTSVLRAQNSFLQVWRLFSPLPALSGYCGPSNRAWSSSSLPRRSGTLTRIKGAPSAAGRGDKLGVPAYEASHRGRRMGQLSVAMAHGAAERGDGAWGS
eukprot:356567-Chlamydomonas_euryale.AAC.4